MCSDPLYVNGDMFVPHIAKNTCDNSIITPIKPLPLHTDCKSYSFEIPFKINYKA